MPQTALIPAVIATAAIAVLVMLLASTRRSLWGPVRLPSGKILEYGTTPSGYWLTIGVTAGIILGLVLGFLVHTLVGGISIGIGVGLILGKVLTQRYDKDTPQYTQEQQQERLRHATWGLIVMILLVLGTLLAALLPLLD